MEVVLHQINIYGGTSERKTRLLKIVKSRRIDKLFTDLIFSYFTVLEALFNVPRWMHLFGFPCIGVGGYPYLPGSNTTWGEVKATLCSGFNEKGLWATSMYIRVKGKFWICN